MSNLISGDIKKTLCDLNGQIVEESKKNPHHYYIVISDTNYNKSANFVLAVPITSKQSIETVNYGIDLMEEDIEYDQIKPQHAKIAKRILEDSHYGERKITTYLYDNIMELEEMVAISRESDGEKRGNNE